MAAAEEVGEDVKVATEVALPDATCRRVIGASAVKENVSPEELEVIGWQLQSVRCWKRGAGV